MRIALVQSHPVVGDFSGNVDALVRAVAAAARQGADLAVTCELAIPGYASRDRFLQGSYIDGNLRALDSLAKRCAIPTIAGFCDRADAVSAGGIHNAAALLSDGATVAVYHKVLLPTYDVFDEARYFVPGGPAQPFDFDGVKLGVSICEDMWADEHRRLSEHHYDRDPVSESVAGGAEILINLSASPFALGKRKPWRTLLAAQASKHRRPLVVVNQVGGDDDLLFLGGSLAFDNQGQLRALSSETQADCTLVTIDTTSREVSGPMADGHHLDEAGEFALLLDGLVMGTRDYATKCGFRSAVLGLSGGIDSAVTAAIAAAALGAHNVYGVALPSRFSSSHALRDAEALATNLGMPFAVIPIAESVAQLEAALAPHFHGHAQDVTEENLQARVRGVILMALSNKHGHLLLNTGNKSEMAVGYCTLYGDMCGGLAVLGDVYKTRVYQLAHEINRRHPGAIPSATLEKAPSAELRSGQLDSDSLPEYDVLDGILGQLLEGNATPEEMRAAGFAKNTVADVRNLIARAEYKRRQSPPVLRVTHRAFGPGRRMPLAAHPLG